MGFAARSGKISSGQEQVINSIRNGKAKLVILADDTSDSSKKKIRDKCNYYGVDCIEIMDRDELSKCVGKIAKTCISINDDGFMQSIIKEYEKLNIRGKEADKGGAIR